MNLITYNHSRPFGPYIIPISIQSSYLRMYCSNNNLTFSLPLTEYCVKNSYFALSQRVSAVLNIRKAEERITILTSSIYVFAEIEPDSTLFRLLDSPDIALIGILENFHGNIECCINLLTDIDRFHNLVHSPLS